jgi:chorismate dehydratase
MSLRLDRASLRLGAVSYLNTKPLVYGLADLLPQAEIVYDLPSRLADRLAAAELDVALIPSVEFFQNPLYEIVSDACIGCRGPVWSVKLFSRVPVGRIGTLALDEGSRTSAALVQILLAERAGITPQLLPLPIGDSPLASPADAILLIGDRAIHEPQGEWSFVWDLGEEWNRWAGLPFVFAMWIARPGIEPLLLEQVDSGLRQARDLGLMHLAEIAEREAPHVRISPEECLSYLRDNLYFFLGPREQRGLEAYYRHAAQQGLAPAGRRWRQVESTAA